MLKLRKHIQRINYESAKNIETSEITVTLKKISMFVGQAVFSIIGTKVSTVETDNQFLRASVIEKKGIFCAYYEVSFALAEKIFETPNTENMLRIWNSFSFTKKQEIILALVIIRNNRKIYNDLLNQKKDIDTRIVEAEKNI